MFKHSRIIHYQCLTPLHCGASEASGAIDLPIARERTTGFPIIPATSLKGVWRDTCAGSGWASDEVAAAFGPDSQSSGTERTNAYAGALGFVDGKILLFPVRTSVGVFALITCPLVLNGYNEARRLSRLSECMALPSDPGTDSILANKKIHNTSAMCLEDISLAVRDLGSWQLPVNVHARERVAIVSDDTFAWFVKQATEVAAHNVLTEKKTSSNLWYEEVVPATAVFYGQVLEGPQHCVADKGSAYVDKLLANKPSLFQVGGHETTGRGLMSFAEEEQI